MLQERGYLKGDKFRAMSRQILGISGGKSRLVLHGLLDDHLHCCSNHDMRSLLTPAAAQSLAKWCSHVSIAYVDEQYFTHVAYITPHLSAP